ncbi:MAG TPA: hypothetical protein VFI92_08255 [Steroidobacteraceae bacterium]|nr:hypothetical protein [Steroidobacteraceae bacterium]
MQATALLRDDHATSHDSSDSAKYARCIKASKRARWDIDADVIRGRDFDFAQAFLPAGLSKVDELAFLTGAERRLLSQVQGRTYAYIFGLVERYIGAKVLELSGQHWLGDQVALEALVRFSDEELKHQELFRRIENMLERRMPPGYTKVADPNEVARAVLGKSTWAVLALTCHIELFTQQHYQQSIDPQEDLSPLWKDVFKYHWAEEVQHAMLDELEWVRENSRVTLRQKEQAVTDLIDLVGAVDGILQAQAEADAGYFLRIADRRFNGEEETGIRALLLRAYRWQYIVSGVQHPHFGRLLTSMTTDSQMQRIQSALAPIMAS